MQIMLPSIQINLLVQHISLNREGSSVLLSGYGGVYVMYIHDRMSSVGNTTVCRYEDDILRFNFNPICFR